MFKERKILITPSVIASPPRFLHFYGGRSNLAGRPLFYERTIHERIEIATIWLVPSLAMTKMAKNNTFLEVLLYFFCFNFLSF
ncbi:MAG: hypothetical protein COY82_00045 [Parcubacteria group bacterium CG_4_10_14_0_8_um_filter_35_7]|nr:MAG: hypothetical protein COY82_00045 [Parcubacteria group bacterium CG_4_10_14_0_8_um_filter_35_7]